MSVRSMLALGAIASVLAVGGAANAQTYNANPNAMAARRGENGSYRNLVSVRRKLEKLIDEMQRDSHDYNGNRVKAIQDLQNARADIEAALQWDRNHPGQ